MKNRKTTFLVAIVVVFIGNAVIAQKLSVDGICRPRVEYRDLISMPTFNPITDASHRLRLNINYSNDSTRLKTRFVLQDARVWGNNDQKANSDYNSFSVFEGWGQYYFTPKLLIKVGRQELSYDNEMIFTKADLHQQGRSHDMGMLKYEGPVEVTVGAAVNNDTRLLQMFKVPYQRNNYKNLQFVRFEKKGKRFIGSIMALNSGLEYYDNTKTDTIQVNYYQELGVYGKYFITKRLFTVNSFYYQMGKDQYNLDLSAYSLNLQMSYVVKPKSLIATAAFDVYSGNTSDTKANENNSFSLPFGSLILNCGLPGMYTLTGADGKIAYHKGLVQPRVNITLMAGKLTLLNKVFIPFSYGELYDNSGVEVSKSLGIEDELYLFYNLSKEVTFNAIIGYFLMSNSMDFNPHSALGNFTYYDRNPLWILAGFTFTPKFL